jgi:hypothetical protein
VRGQLCGTKPAAAPDATSDCGVAAMTRRYRRSPDQLCFDFMRRELAESPAATSASVIRFPAARWRPLIAKVAAEMQAAPPELSEKVLLGRLARFGRKLRRQHVSEEAINRELRALEIAVRAAAYPAGLVQRSRR